MRFQLPNRFGFRDENLGQAHNDPRRNHGACAHGGLGPELNGRPLTIRPIVYRDRMQPGTCVHFRGGQHATCGAGVDLISVRDTSIRPYRWPCSDFGEGPAATTCERYLEPTTEQFATSKAEMDAVIALMDSRTKRGECCECGEPMADVRQVGACIYATPCGCRQGTGDASELRRVAGLDVS